MIIPDLHMHSTASDGTDSPEQILQKVRQAGINRFSLTDHDTYEGAEKILPLAAGDPDVKFAVGIELSCKDPKGKYHILGYRFDPDSLSMRHIVEKAHDNRVYKVLGRLKFLEETFGFTFTWDEKDELMANPNPGKPHIGNLMVKKGYAKTKEEAILNYVNRYRSDRTLYLKPEEAIEAILAGGGIPMLAHPIFGDGGQNLTREELLERVERLDAVGLAGLECYYSRYTEEQQEMLLEIVSERGLFASAGSDYHGKNKTVRLGQTGMSAEKPLHPCFERFLQEIHCD